MAVDILLEKVIEKSAKLGSLDYSDVALPELDLASLFLPAYIISFMLDWLAR